VPGQAGEFPAGWAQDGFVAHLPWSCPTRPSLKNRANISKAARFHPFCCSSSNEQSQFPCSSDADSSAALLSNDLQNFSPPGTMRLFVPLLPREIIKAGREHRVSANAGRIASYAATSSIWRGQPQEIVRYAKDALAFYAQVPPCNAHLPAKRSPAWTSLWRWLISRGQMMLLTKRCRRSTAND
jgi:hypothetical protein